jgi:hypothetical protein
MWHEFCWRETNNEAMRLIETPYPNVLFPTLPSKSKEIVISPRRETMMDKIVPAKRPEVTTVSEPPSNAPQWRATPELQQPPKHELKFWLEPRASNPSQPTSGSALLTMAQNFGARRGAAGASIGLGMALALAAITNLLTANSAPLPALWLGLSAVALLLIGFHFWRQAVTNVPQVRFLSTGRASVSIAGGWILAAVIGIPLLVIAHVALAVNLDGSLRGILAYAGYQLALLLSVIAVFYLPGHFSQHARRDLRRLLETNTTIRSEVEELSRTWVDPVGTTSFGPL